MGTLNNKKLLSLLILISVSSFVFASCGSCQDQVKHPTLKKNKFACNYNT